MTTSPSTVISPQMADAASFFIHEPSLGLHTNTYAGRIVGLTDCNASIQKYEMGSVQFLACLYAWVKRDDAQDGLTAPKYTCHLVEQKQFAMAEEMYRGHALPIATAWKVDADWEDVLDFYSWYEHSFAPDMANTIATNNKEKFLVPLRNEWNRITTPSIIKGQTYRVVGGRKFPKGKMGKVFWNGQNKFGWSIGLAWSDKKDATGKFTDVGFVSTQNLEYVPNDDDDSNLRVLQANAQNTNANTDWYDNALSRILYYSPGRQFTAGVKINENTDCVRTTPHVQISKLGHTILADEFSSAGSMPKETY